VRIGMVHQPHFLPWPGYLARCLAVDVFIALDNVKFNRNHYQQRTKFIDRNAKLRWLSLPIDGATRSGLISDVKIAFDFAIRKWQRPVVESYRDAPSFDQTWRGVTEVISAYHPNFCDVSLELIKWVLCNMCDSLSRPKAEVVRASKIEVSNDRTGRLVDICRDQEITHLVMGDYALGSHDIDLLIDSGISLVSQKYVGPEQSYPAPGVMGLHYIFRNGSERTAMDLASHWTFEQIAN